MASRGVNKVILTGNLGQDLEVCCAPNGGTVANITLTASEFWCGEATGRVKKQTEWRRIALLDKPAEVASEYLHKGPQVCIEGQLCTRKRTDQSGVEEYTTEAVVNVDGTMQMLSGCQGGGAPASGGRQQGGWGQLRQSQGSNQFSGGAWSRP